MFEHLYRYSRVLARHLDGPADEERDRFVAHFAELGATRDSVSNLASALLVVAQRLDVSGTRAVTPEEVVSVADRWVQHHRRRGRSISPGRRQRFVQVATDWLRFMGRLQLQPAKPGAGTDLIGEFARHMQRERGLSPITINGRCWHVRAFLTWLAEQHSGAEGATLHQVDAFLSLRGNPPSRFAFTLACPGVSPSEAARPLENLSSSTPINGVSVWGTSAYAASGAGLSVPVRVGALCVISARRSR